MNRRAARILAEIEERIIALKAVIDDAGGDEADEALPTAVEPPPALDLLEVPEAARRFGVAPDTLRSWLRRDASLGKKVGGRWHASTRRLQERLR
jgi:hypothetical protein